MGSQTLLWQKATSVVVICFAGLKLTNSNNCLNCCEIFIVYAKYTNMTARHIKQAGEPRLGDPRFTMLNSETFSVLVKISYRPS